MDKAQEASKSYNKIIKGLAICYIRLVNIFDKEKNPNPNLKEENIYIAGLINNEIFRLMTHSFEATFENDHDLEHYMIKTNNYYKVLMGSEELINKYIKSDIYYIEKHFLKGKNGFIRIVLKANRNNKTISLNPNLTPDQELEFKLYKLSMN